MYRSAPGAGGTITLDMPNRPHPFSWTRRGVLAAGAAAWAAGSAKAADLHFPNKIRVGLIGLEGHFGEATGLAADHPDVQITAYAIKTPREEQRGARNKALADAKRYSDYRAMLDAESLDAVCICDQNWERAASVQACLEAKIPTAAEKPMGVSLDELEDVEETARKTGTPLTMLLPMRFYPAFRAMRRIVEEGRIGEPVNLSGQKSYQLGPRPEWMKDRKTYGGTIPYIACHTVDLLCFISGRDMVRTAAFHGHVGSPETREMENTAAISYQLDNGGTADIRLDYLRPKAATSHGDDRIRIAGAKGVIEYRAGKVTLVTNDEPLHEVTDLPQKASLFGDFLASVYNKSTPMLTKEEAFRVTRIVLRSREAADHGLTLDI